MKAIKSAGGAAAALAFLASAQGASAQVLDDQMLGEIRIFGFNFCPRSWSSASGQLLAISGNEALYSLYGTTFGGDGRTNFALPDARGRKMTGTGQGSGLPYPIQLGERAGANTTTLAVTEMPAHTHEGRIVAANVPPTTTDPDGAAVPSDENRRFFTSEGSVDQNMRSGTVQTDPVGGGQSFPVKDPLLGVTVCVAMQGIYPSRN